MLAACIIILLILPNVVQSDIQALEEIMNEIRTLSTEQDKAGKELLLEEIE